MAHPNNQPSSANAGTTTAKDGWSVRIPRSEAVQFQYRLRPYLGNATDHELEARLNDILRNIYCFTHDCRIGPLSPDRGGAMWMERLMHLQLELYRRGTHFDRIGRFEDMPWNARALALMRENMALTPLTDRRGIFCKYGDGGWLRRTLDQGLIRLSPASYYRGAEHNVARQDDELTLATYVTPYDYDFGRLHESLRSVLPPRGWVTVSERKPSDHLLYCMTVRFDFRYFFDFRSNSAPAEACLVIRDQDAFVQRLVDGVTTMLPGWTTKFDAVRYVDPYTFVALIGWAGEDMYFFKSFRYMYQVEHRLVVIPPERYSAALTHFELELGSLADIAELVYLKHPVAAA